MYFSGFRHHTLNLVPAVKGKLNLLKETLTDTQETTGYSKTRMPRPITN